MAAARPLGAAWVAAALVAAALLGWLGLTGFAWTDYEDEVAPALAALVRGDVGEFLARCPAYGGSLILRAPFALLPGVWGGGELAVYRAVAVPCLLAGALLGLVLAGRARARGQGVLACAAVVGVCAANPLTLRALEVGHPEELLAAAGCVGAVLAAMARRPLAAGVLLGLAVGAKPWAVLAAGPVLLALPFGRPRAALAAAVSAGLLVGPILLAGSAEAVAGGAGRTGQIFQPWQAWWWLGSHGEVVRGLYGEVKPGYRVPPEWLSSLTHPLIVAVSVPLSLLWARTRRHPADALLLLALLLLVRCLLDPWNTVYYVLPPVIALAAWEAVRRDGPPVLALGATAAAWITFEEVPGRASADVQSLVFLAWALPLAVLLARWAYSGRDQFWPATSGPKSEWRSWATRRNPARS